MREKTITIAGNPYTVTAISATSYAAIHDEWRKTAPDPVKALILTAEDLPEDMRKDFIKENLAEAHREKRQRSSITNAEFGEWLRGKDGAQRTAREMFRKHHPNLTDEVCFDLISEAVNEHGESAFADLFSDEHKKPAKERRR